MPKNIVIIILLSISCSNANAQNKVGFINLDSVISVMPETITANFVLKNYHDSLLQEYEQLQHLADSISNSFLRNIDYLQPQHDTIIKRDGFLKIYQQIQGFSERSQNLEKQKKEQTFAPIKQKAIAAMRRVVQENNYAYIINIDEVIFYNPADDIFPLVVNALGIREGGLKQEAFQYKAGFIDFDSLINKMPETAVANLILKDFQDSLGHAYDKLQLFADSLSSIGRYCDDCAPYPDSVKSFRRNQLLKIYEQIQNFAEFAQNRAKQKAKEMFAPIEEKAMAAIRKVAQENNYTYIINTKALMFYCSGDDIFPLVIIALGIKEDAIE